MNFSPVINMSSNLLSIGQYFYSSASQVWATVTIFSCVLIRERMINSNNEMDKCFLICQPKVLKFKSTLRNFNRIANNDEKIFENRNDFFDFIDRYPNEDAFFDVSNQGIPTIGNAADDQSNLNDISSVKRYASIFRGHQKKFDEDKVSIRNFFFSGFALTVAALLFLLIVESLTICPKLFFCISAVYLIANIIWIYKLYRKFV